MGWIRERILAEHRKHYRVTGGLDWAKLAEDKILMSLRQETVVIQGWKGKSSMELRDFQDKILVIKYQKPERGKEPKQVKTEISKSELERLKAVIRRHFAFGKFVFEGKDGKKYLKSTDIAEFFYKLSWNEIFNQRKKHNTFTIMLNVLDKQDFIEYKGGRVYLRTNI